MSLIHRSHHGARTLSACGPLLVLVLSLGAGCKGSTRFEAPPIDASAATDRAFAEYDSNHDGFLDETELMRCPALAGSLDDLDRDHDKRVSRAELKAVLASCREDGIGLVERVCTVRLDDAPLSGAQIVLEPEPFLGSAVKPAQGKTDDRGRARMQMEGASQPGCQVGFYRVRITKTEKSGREIVPDRYNRETQLGLAVLPRSRGSSAFHLSSHRQE